ncbi:MAG: hypothetical protein MJZ52_07135 [Bacteroidales bacterium]|nr:hypothetical protein [Bacteroidales bacterium]
MDDRKKELETLFESALGAEQFATIRFLIEDFVFLESQMAYYKTLPFIRVNPRDPSQQKRTEAARLYKECSQSYMNAARILCGLLAKSTGDEVDPVSEFLAGLNNG